MQPTAADVKAREQLWLQRIDAAAQDALRPTRSRWQPPPQARQRIACVRVVRECCLGALDLLYSGRDPWELVYRRSRLPADNVESSLKLLKIAELMLEEESFQVSPTESPVVADDHRRNLTAAARALPSTLAGPGTSSSGDDKDANSLVDLLSPVDALARQWPHVLLQSTLATVYYMTTRYRRALMHSTDALRRLTSLGIEPQDWAHCAHAAAGGARGLVEQLVVCVINHAAILLALRKLPSACQVAELAAHLAKSAHQLLLVAAATFLGERMEAHHALLDFESPMTVLSGRTAVPLLLSFALMVKGNVLLAMEQQSAARCVLPSRLKVRPFHASRDDDDGKDEWERGNHHPDDEEEVRGSGIGAADLQEAEGVHLIVAVYDAAASCAKAELGDAHMFVRYLQGASREAADFMSSKIKWIATAHGMPSTTTRSSAASAAPPSLDDTLKRLNAMQAARSLDRFLVTLRTRHAARRQSPPLAAPRRRMERREVLSLTRFPHRQPPAGAVQPPTMAVPIISTKATQTLGNAMRHPMRPTASPGLPIGRRESGRGEVAEQFDGRSHARQASRLRLGGASSVALSGDTFESSN